MRFSVAALGLVLLSFPLLAQTALSAKQISPKILAAKTAFFDDQSGVPAVGNATLAELRKWNRFQLVPDRSEADLVFVLSTSTPRGGDILYSGGQTGRIDQSGAIEPDPVPTPRKSAPVRAAYLAVFDSRSGELLWRESHRWGGLVTGYNSAGRRLVAKFKKQTEK